MAADADALLYTRVPEYEAWMIPLENRADTSEYDDLLRGLRWGGPDRFRGAIRGFREACASSELSGVRFAVGTDLPEEVTLVLRPDSKAQAATILQRASGLLAPNPQGTVPWGRVSEHLWAIRAAVVEGDAGMIPSFGLSAMIRSSSEARYRPAPASWIGANINDVATGQTADSG